MKMIETKYRLFGRKHKNRGRERGRGGLATILRHRLYTHMIRGVMWGVGETLTNWFLGGSGGGEQTTRAFEW